MKTDLVKKNVALTRTIPYLEPGKLVLDAVQGSFKEYLSKDFGETDDRLDSVVDSCIVLLEKLIQMNRKITPKVKQEAAQLGVNWIGKVKSNPNNRNSRVLACLVFLAAYGLASVTTSEVLLTLLERVLLYNQAPKLFRLLGLEDKVSGAVETLKKKEEYLATLRFICEFRLFKLCPGGRAAAILTEYLDSSDKAARVIAGTGNSIEAQKASREKIKADAAIALECIRVAKAESMFPAKHLKKLVALKNDEPAQRATEAVEKSFEKRQSTTNAVEKSEAVSSIPYKQMSVAKRQRLTEPITPFKNSTVNRLGVSVSSGEKIKVSGDNHQSDAKATYPLSTETKPNILSGSIKADMLRELVEKQPLEESNLSNAIKCTPDPAKLVLDTSMALCPTNPEGGYEFKLLITSASCSLLLDHLKKLSPQIGHPLKADTKKLAVYWKYKISQSKTDKLEVVCFLQFLGIFGIVSEFKADDLLGLLDNAYWRAISPDLCQFLGLDSAIPGFIQNLIKTGHRIKAIDYIYSFDMVDRFQPVSAIINDFLGIIKDSAEKSFRDAKAKNESAGQVAAIDRQIRSLRAAIKCISSHKLESEFQLGNLEEQIKSLWKLRRNISDQSGSKPETAKPPNLAEVGPVTSNTPPESKSGSKPDVTVKQSETEIPPNLAEVGSVTRNTPPESKSGSKPDLTAKQCETAKPPNLAEVGSVTSNTPLEHSKEAASSSVSKPYFAKKNKRGKKRSMSGNNQRSVHVASHTSNHYPGHGYSLNQRQTWPVDHYGRSFSGSPNSDYNYSQWRQPGGPQFYRFYQHDHNPFYRNRF